MLSLHPRVRIILLQTAILVTLGAARVYGTSDADAEATGILEALGGGSPSLDLRLRYEHAEIDGLRDSDALTLRARVGYRTKSFHGFQGYLELEATESIGSDDTYSQAGLNSGGAGRAVIADVENAELNQGYVSYDGDNTHVTLGRQRIILDNARFIGNVGWRQNEQTYDAVTIRTQPVGKLDLFYGYVGQVNRIFGRQHGSHPDGEAGNAAYFDADAHLVNVAYQTCPYCRITGYAYLLDLGNGTVAAANSSDTYGVRMNLSAPLTESVTVACDLEHAQQIDNSATTSGVDYQAEYYLADLRAESSRYAVGVAYEELGTDNGVSFKTPLATGHKFNGWADVFVVTPAQGLVDTYAYVTAKTLPLGVQGTVVYHLFKSDVDSIDYGQELDLVASRKFGDHVKVIAKFADYRASDSGPANPVAGDVQRFWLETDITF